MSQSLELNIKTTSDVPQAMEKAKAATVGFGKQVDDIQKKFSMAFKDIFLSFLGPIALLGVAINYIGKLIDDNRKKHSDANQAAIDQTNELMSAEDQYYAKKRANEKKDKENREQASISREDITRDFILNDPRGLKILYESKIFKQGPGKSAAADYLAQDKATQERVQALIAEDMKKNPMPSGEKKDFKGPEGFSNVIGVGPNPVLEAMAQQTEIALAQLAELQKISGTSNGVPTDFTKTPQK
jgi:hypothetical protein